MSARTALVVYFALAVAAGILVATSLLPWPTDFVLLVVIGIGATQVRRRVLRPQSSWTLEVQWLALFAAVWLPLAWVLRAWPFRS